jgi:hypothetical protein
VIRHGIVLSSMLTHAANSTGKTIGQTERTDSHC